MTTAELSIRSKPATTTDVGTIWKAAIEQYEKITKVKIEFLARANNVDEILAEIHKREKNFKDYRHDGSKSDKIRSFARKSLGSIEKLSNIVGPAVSTVRQ
jgi:fungal STAND N-terminal Goodbye domain